VGVPHRALVNFLDSMRRAPGFAPGERLLAVTSLAFDIAALEIFLPLTTGGCVEIASRAEVSDGALLAERLRASGASVLQATPATWRMLLDAGWTGDPGLRALCGGEALPRELAASLAGRTRELWNLYGPTETTVWSAAARIRPDESGPVSIGRPIAQTRIHLLDVEMQTVPLGVTGELWIGGAGLARGYLGRPDLTAERFLPDPFAAEMGEPGGRLYRTGDLARYLTGGRMEVLGRIDHQIKLRGFRIELGEIEAALAAVAGVREAVVALRGDRLVAYVVGMVGDVPADALRQDLRERLPDYMVPAAFVLLPALPLTPNGKVDRQALPAPEQQGGGKGSLAPRTPVEEVLAGLWAELLGLERIGTADHFFDLGGHSLLATRVMSRLRGAFGIELPLRDLFEAPRLADLAARVEAALQAGSGSVLPPLAPVPREGALPLSFAQQRLWLVDQLEPGSPLYNIPVALRIAGPLRPEVLALCFGEIVRRHEVLRTVFADRKGAPVQVIQPAAPFGLPVVDLAGLPEREREAAARLLAGEEALRPFDLARGPLLRGLLLRLAPPGDQMDHAAALTLHHIAGDGWSMEILVREVTALYAAFAEGRPSLLPELPIQYADFAIWQREWLQGEVLDRQLDYWRARLAGLAPSELPSDRPRLPVRSSQGASLPVAIPGPLADALRSLARQEDATLFMVLLAAFSVLVHRSSGCDRLVLGTDIANRRHAELEGLIGLFVNQLVLSFDLSGDPTFREVLRQVRRDTLEAYLHQDAPFDRLVELLRPERDLSRTPLFQLKLVLQNAPAAAQGLLDLAIAPLDFPLRTAKFDLLLNLRETAAGIGGNAEYSTDLFEAATISRLLDAFALVLRSVTERPDARLGEIAAELARQEALEEERRDQERRSLALTRARRRVLVDQNAS
jgi:non-ribosomal peptide synthetase component F/acyl carrier protein